MADRPAATPRGGLTFRSVIALVVIVIALIFIVQNTTSVPITFLGLEVTLPVFVVLIVMFVLGMLLGGVVRTLFRKWRDGESTT
jgi:lipopolysaccharide assembly protein A